jgi:hypothetical protein
VRERWTDSWPGALDIIVSTSLETRQIPTMIANLDQKEDTSTLGALRRRIGGGSANGVQKERVVLSAPQRVDGDEPVNEFDMESIW